MSAVQHTPGRWAVNRETPVIVYSADGYGIAITATEDMASRDDMDECEANARLIAAAPDLLAIVQSVLVNERHLNDEHFAGVQARLMVMARAAIAKATGAE